MNFQKRPISKKPAEKKSKQPPKQPISKKTLTPRNAKIITLIFACVIIVGLIYSIAVLAKNLDIFSIISSAGKNLQVDTNGHTNILLTGIGGKGHDGADLTDSIIVASIDYDRKAVAMLSIPRDLWISDKRFTNGGRINTIYSIEKNNFTSVQRMENLKQVVEEISGVDIQYWVKIDFKGFTEIIDSIGGVDVNVEKPIYDTTYPRGENGAVETFSLPVGPRHLDGTTALKFARSRHGIGDGDFARARRQQQLITAIKEKTMNLNILSDPAKIQSLYASISSNLETDFEPNEIIELAKIAKEFEKENIVSRVLTNHSTNCGGFLYIPPREKYGNADVFLPLGNNYNYLHIFTKKFLMDPLSMNDASPIQVLNGTKTNNIAGKVTSTLSRFCLNITHTGNTENKGIKESTLYYKVGPKGEKPALLDFLTLLLPPMKLQEGIPPTYLLDEKKDTSFIIELGEDYLQKQLKEPNEN